MEAVWPLSALYSGALGLEAYFRWERPMSPRWMQARRRGMSRKPFWADCGQRHQLRRALCARRWFMMQVGMLIGFTTTYPVNWCLIRHGIKDIM